jgi:hypothetical protein
LKTAVRNVRPDPNMRSRSISDNGSFVMSSRTTITDGSHAVPKVKFLPLIQRGESRKISAARRSSVYTRINRSEALFTSRTASERALAQFSIAWAAIHAGRMGRFRQGTRSSATGAIVSIDRRLCWPAEDCDRCCLGEEAWVTAPFVVLQKTQRAA